MHVSAFASSDDASARRADEPLDFGQEVLVILGVGGEHAIDHHGQDGHFGAANGIGQGEVDRRVLERTEGSIARGFGKGADQIASPGSQLRRPFGVRNGCCPVAFVEGIEPVAQSVAEDDRLAADGLGHGSVLALRIARNIHTPPKGERAGVERLRQRGPTGADDSDQHDVRSGDQASLVEHPRVVDEGFTGLEVLLDEDAGRAESGPGEKRVVA